MPRKKRFEGKKTKVVGLRVPIDIVEEIKEPLREFADYYVENRKSLSEILKENDNDNNTNRKGDNT